MMVPRAAVYRARARAQLGGNVFANNWLMAFVLCLLQSVLFSFGSYLLIGGIFVNGLCMYGMARAFLAVARGERDNILIDDLFYGKDILGDLFVLALLKTLFLLLWGLIPFVGIVKAHSYAMVYYIKYDHPEYDWRTCITESRRLMDGNKWRLFCLNLSFGGWMLVGSLCFGVGVFWVTAYMQAATANFYDDLKKAQDARFAAREAA